MKSKIVIKNNHNVSVNANINNANKFGYEEENIKGNSSNNVANKVLGALAMGNGGN